MESCRALPGPPSDAGVVDPVVNFFPTVDKLSEGILGAAELEGAVSVVALSTPGLGGQWVGRPPPPPPPSPPLIQGEEGGGVPEGMVDSPRVALEDESADEDVVGRCRVCHDDCLESQGAEVLRLECGAVFHVSCCAHFRGPAPDHLLGCPRCDEAIGRGPPRDGVEWCDRWPGALRVYHHLLNSCVVGSPLPVERFPGTLQRRIQDATVAAISFSREAREGVGGGSGGMLPLDEWVVRRAAVEVENAGAQWPGGGSSGLA